MYRREQLTQNQRIQWFFHNYYETGMELEHLLKTMQNEDLDNFVWYGKKIYIPKFRDELIEIV